MSIELYTVLVVKNQNILYNNKMHSKKRIVLILMLISLFAAQVFSAKKSPISVPTKVQNKIKETQETPKCWYICELKGKTKAGNVLCGPVESREHILLIWIANSCKPDKDFCIAKNKTYITKNPEKFFADDFAKVKNDISEFGVAQTYEKYFFTNYLTSKTIKLEVNKEDETAASDSSEEEPQEEEQPEQTKAVAKAEEPEPAETEPEPAEPEITETAVETPEIKEPVVAEAEKSEPEISEPEITEPEIQEVEIAEVKNPEPEIKEPQIAETKKTEPAAAKPEIIVPEPSEPVAAEPEPLKPKETITANTQEQKPVVIVQKEPSQTTKSTRFSEPYVSSDGSLVYKEEYEQSYDTLNADQGIIISELKSELKNQIKDELINELRSELKTTTPAETQKNLPPEPKTEPLQSLAQTQEPSEIPQVPEVQETPQAPEIAQTTELAQTPETTQLPEVTQVPELPEIPQTTQPVEITKTTEEPDNNFELPLSTEPAKAVARYQRENLLDYAPKKTPALPVDEVVPEYEIIKEPDKADNKGCTLLMKASKEGNDRDIRNLLSSGAKINLKDKEGWNALMYAVRYQESITVIEQLITAGVNIKEKNKYGVSALTLCATYNSNPQILNRLLSAYNPTDKEVMQAFILMLSDNSSSEYSKSIKTDVFLNKGIMLNTFYNSKTPLMYACQYCTSTAIIKKLLDNGASASVRAADGKTAFDYAKDNSYLPHDDTYWMLNRK